MSISEIAAKYDVSRSSVHSYRSGGTFPRPAPVEGTEKTKLRFRSDEVAAWFEANPKSQGKRTDLATKKQQGEPMTTTPPSTDDVTADDVERLVNALLPEARRAFEAMVAELTRMEISRARILNDPGDAALYIKLELNGEIGGIRKGICCLLGIPLEEAEHEEAVDSYMRWRWDESDWEGWPK